MEGVSSEAASLAGHLKLGKLIYMYDDNHVTLSAGTDLTFTEDRARRFEAYGWRSSRSQTATTWRLSTGRCRRRVAKPNARRWFWCASRPTNRTVLNRSGRRWVPAKCG